MRLIRASTYELIEFPHGDVPPYAILSHRWGEEEITLQDMQVFKVAQYMGRILYPLSSLSLQEMQAWSIIDSMQRLTQPSNDSSKTFADANSSMSSLMFVSHIRAKRGFAKIEHSCKAALADQLQYVWVDTCCIDKSSSAELSEAVNSMYLWYHNAAICYAYLSDVLDGDFATLSRGRPSKDSPDTYSKFACSAWFTRGWTLQELVAPPRVRFYTYGWRHIGDKADLASALSDASGVDNSVLKGRIRAQDLTIATRMQWASKRKTTRIEDLAYCLLGLFDVNMPLLYGEGEKAFLRLQEEIIKRSDDHSIFAWTMLTDEPQGLLASSPEAFVDCSTILRRARGASRTPYSMTNVGLSIPLRMRPSHIDTYEALLDCYDAGGNSFISIYLYKLSGKDQYARIQRNGTSRRSVFESGEGESWSSRTAYVGQQPILTVPYPCHHGFILRKLPKEPSGWSLDDVLDHDSWNKQTGSIDLRSHDLPAYCQLHFSDDPARLRFVILLGISHDFHLVAELQLLRNVTVFSKVSPTPVLPRAQSQLWDEYSNKRPRDGDILEAYWYLRPSCYIWLKVSESSLRVPKDRKLFVDIQVEKEKPVSKNVLSCRVGKPVLSRDVQRTDLRTYW